MKFVDRMLLECYFGVYHLFLYIVFLISLINFLYRLKYLEFLFHGQTC